MNSDDLIEMAYGTPMEGQIAYYVELANRGDQARSEQVAREIDYGMEWSEARQRHVNVRPSWDALEMAATEMGRRRDAEAQARATAEPVGLAEIAERLGVERGTVDMWRHRELLPEPRWTVGGRPAWSWGDIEDWAEQTGRH